MKPNWTSALLTIASLVIALAAFALVVLARPAAATPARSAGGTVSTLVSGEIAVGDAVVMDDAGHLFATSYTNRVATVAPDGAVTVLATDMSQTTGLALHAATSTLYVGNNGTGTIRTLPVAGGSSSVFLTGVGAVGLAVNPTADTLYVAHYNFNSVSRIALDGVDSLTTFASTGLNGPTGLAFGDDGLLYASNFGNGRIKRIDADGNVTLVGLPPNTSTIGYLANRDGFLYATSFDGHQIWKVGYDGTMELYAGSGTPGLVDGPALTAQFHQPNGITTSVSGDTLNVWVSEFANRSIRRIIEVNGVTAVSTIGTAARADLQLGPSLPNPFASATRITVDLARSAHVDLTIHDVTGRRVRSLSAGGTLAAGVHTFLWNGLDDDRQAVPAGTYFYRAQSADGVSTGRVTRLR
jgi:sugar lactone lactonase YvrE